MIDRAEEFAESPPAEVCFETTDHTPSLSVPRSQLVTVGEATNVQVTLVAPDFDAVTVTVFPDVAPVTVISGVLSFVMLSVDELPLSDAAAKSGVDGTATADTVAVIVEVTV